jgi:cytochrome c oxidase subunit 4
MAYEPLLTVRTYGIVLVALIVLTLLTVGVSFIALSPAWHETIGLLIAAVKASLVVLFFMHVIHSPRLTWAIVAVSIAWLVILVSLTFVDYFSRDMIPFMPGH